MTAATAVMADVRRLNERFEGAHPSEAIRWAVENVTPGRLIVSSSFGSTGMVNLHLLSEIAPEVPVAFIDTLYHFPETLEHAERVKAHYGLDVRVYRPAASREVFEEEYGERLWESDLELFHRLTRVEPMKRALRGVESWDHRASPRPVGQPFHTGPRGDWGSYQGQSRGLLVGRRGLDVHPCERRAVQPAPRHGLPEPRRPTSDHARF